MHKIMKKDTKRVADEKMMRLATVFSVGVALIIISVKLVAWVMTDSLSLLSSLVDSVLDVLASLISFFAVRYSLQPADEDHRFGHGKAEDIAAFAQSAFIAGSGAFIFIEAISRFITPHKIEHEAVGIAVMVFSSILTLALISYQRHVIKHTNSSAIKADSLHYHTDLLVNALVILSFIVVMVWDVPIVDPILAFVISAYIFMSAWKVGRGAFDKLMDKEFDDSERKRIMDVILSHPEVKGMHDLRTRSSGIKPFIQFHLELDREISLVKAHEISDVVEMELIEIFPNAEVLIHQDIEGDARLEVGRVVPLTNGE